MIALAVVLRDDLPVRVDLVIDAMRTAHICEAIALEVGKAGQPLRERHRVRVEIDEHEAAVRAELDWIERKVLGAEAGREGLNGVMIERRSRGRV